jgi:hypothetical protein
MTDKKDGGPAFPTFDCYIKVPGKERIKFKGGMTLRDYFAGKALCIIHGVERSKLLNPSDVARHAYTIADAMLQERDKIAPKVSKP